LHAVASENEHLDDDGTFLEQHADSPDEDSDQGGWKPHSEATDAFLVDALYAGDFEASLASVRLLHKGHPSIHLCM
jgi:hypothetical protein